MAPHVDGPAEGVFARRLRRLVNEAYADGIDVEGGWPILNEDATEPDWDVVIVRLRKPEP